jgi:hypothetical protein
MCDTDAAEKSDKALVRSLMDFWIALSGALIGAAAGAWVSATLAYKQQIISAQLVDGHAAALLRQSARGFASNSASIAHAFWMLVIAAVVVYALRWRFERRA